MEKEKDVSLWFYTYKEQKTLGTDSEYFAEYLESSLNKKRTYYERKFREDRNTKYDFIKKGYINCMILSSHANRDNHAIEDSLHYIALNLILDFDFAVNLKLFDILDFDCFTSNTKEGKAMLWLLNDLQLSVIVSKREYRSLNDFHIYFVVCETDEVSYMHTVLQNGEFINKSFL